MSTAKPVGMAPGAVPPFVWWSWSCQKLAPGVDIEQTIAERFKPGSVGDSIQLRRLLLGRRSAELLLALTEQSRPARHELTFHAAFDPSLFEPLIDHSGSLHVRTIRSGVTESPEARSRC